jgi:hypothetical protein
MNEFALLARIRPALRRYRQWLVKTPRYAEQHSKYGRWSRWGRNGLIEANVDLPDLAERVKKAISRLGA